MGTQLGYWSRLSGGRTRRIAYALLITGALWPLNVRIFLVPEFTVLGLLHSLVVVMASLSVIPMVKLRSPQLTWFALMAIGMHLTIGIVAMVNTTQLAMFLPTFIFPLGIWFIRDELHGERKVLWAVTLGVVGTLAVHSIQYVLIVAIVLVAAAWALGQLIFWGRSSVFGSTWLPDVVSEEREPREPDDLVPLNPDDYLRDLVPQAGPDGLVPLDPDDYLRDLPDAVSDDTRPTVQRGLAIGQPATESEVEGPDRRS